MEEKYIILLAVCGAAALLIPLFLYLSNNWLSLTKLTVRDGRVREEGVKIIHLSDLHAKSFGRENRRLIKKVRGRSPDIIAITGDIIHKYRKRDIKVAVSLVKGLSALAPVFFVSGNHEMRSIQYRALRQALKEAGAHVLDDCPAHICGLNLFGVNCASIKKGAYFQDSDGEGVSVLLAHLPQYITRYSAAGYTLALCGHAHGGQWRIPFTKLGVYAPGQGLFPRYTCGLHKCGNLSEAISRGLGNSKFPLRLFNRPEIVEINLKRKSGDTNT